MEQFEFDHGNTDVFIYIGEISREGYAKLSKLLLEIPDNKRKENILICMATLGGSPDAGYRIGRCLQHHYAERVVLFAPGLCKSSGTLVAIAANNLIIGNEGELGPLDIQLRKTDEIGEQSSGLDIFKSINYLEEEVVEQFIRYLRAIRFGSGLNTRLSADIAAKLVQSIIEPIASQIDPIKIGEHQRAVGIVQKYGERLNKMTKSLKNDSSLGTLIAGYPSHGFVIDRKEAADLFNKVFKPSNELLSLFKEIMIFFYDFNVLGGVPYVEFLSEEKAEVINNEGALTQLNDNLQSTKSKETTNISSSKRKEKNEKKL